MRSRVARRASSDVARKRALELNGVDVTPIMNMFVILIPFLVSMAVFSHLAVLRFSLPSEGDGGGVRSERQLPLTVAMTAAEIAVTRGSGILLTVTRGEAGHDYAALEAALLDLRAREGAGSDSAVIAVDDGIVFEDVVRCMDTCRGAGFGQIGLAEGTGLDRS